MKIHKKGISKGGLFLFRIMPNERESYTVKGLKGLIQLKGNIYMVKLKPVFKRVARLPSPVMARAELVPILLI